MTLNLKAYAASYKNFRTIPAAELAADKAQQMILSAEINRRVTTHLYYLAAPAESTVIENYDYDYAAPQTESVVAKLFNWLR